MSHINKLCHIRMSHFLSFFLSFEKENTHAHTYTHPLSRMHRTNSHQEILHCLQQMQSRKRKRGSEGERGKRENCCNLSFSFPYTYIYIYMYILVNTSLLPTRVLSLVLSLVNTRCRQESVWCYRPRMD